MVTEKKTVGRLYQGKEEGDEYETFKLYGETEWQGVECQVFIEVDTLLHQFAGKIVEITIKVIEG